MTKIVDTISEGIVKPLGLPITLNLVNLHFCAGKKQHDELGILGSDGINQAFIHIRSHLYWEEDTPRFVFELAMAAKHGSCFSRMIGVALIEKRGFMVDGKHVASWEVDAWFHMKEGADKLPVQESQCRVVSDWQVRQAVLND